MEGARVFDKNSKDSGVSKNVYIFYEKSSKFALNCQIAEDRNAEKERGRQERNSHAPLEGRAVGLLIG